MDMGITFAIWDTIEEDIPLAVLEGLLFCFGVWVHWAFWICGFMIFIKFGNYFFKYLLFPFSLGTPNAYIQGHLKPSHCSGMPCSFSKIIFYLCVSFWILIIAILLRSPVSSILFLISLFSSIMLNLLWIQSSGFFTSDNVIFICRRWKTRRLFQTYSYLHLFFLFQIC